MVSGTSIDQCSKFRFHDRILFLCEEKKLVVSSFDCEVIGQIELHNDRLKFTTIHVYPIIGIDNIKWNDTAKEVIDLTKKHCLISKALSVIIYYHPSIKLTGFETAIKTNAENKKQASNT